MIRRCLGLGGTLVVCGLAALAIASNGPALKSTPATLADFGIKGDGQTDDTAAIQKAVSTLGSVHFPKGTYRITSPIVIELDKTGYAALSADGTATLVMAGSGPAIRFVGTHEGSAAPHTFKQNVWDNQRTPRVERLEIVGAHPEADGIEAIGTMQLSVHGTTIRQCRHGIHLVKRNRNVLISACHIYQNSGIGVYYDDVNLHQSNIVGCHISYCGQGGVVCRAGEVRNLHIGTCDIEGCMAKDGPPAANVFIDCSNGSTAEVAITGCTIQHSSVPGAANIRIHGAGKPSRNLTNPKWGHVTIGDNIFSDVAINVDLKDCRGVTITGNTFWMGYEYDLRVENCDEIVVGPNAFERNPAYAYGTSLTTRNALLFRNCRDCTLTGLLIQAPKGAEAGLFLDECKRCNLSGCSLLDCDGVALRLINPQHCLVTGCLIRNDVVSQIPPVSVQVEGGNGNRFANNLFGNAVDIPKESGEVR